MSLEGYVANPGTAIDLTTFTKLKGPQNFQPSTGSQYNVPLIFNEQIPTGFGLVTYAKSGTAITIIDPNGNGTCKPRLVAVGTFGFTILNSSSATPAAPFTQATGTPNDIATLVATLGTAYTVAPPAPNAPGGNIPAFPAAA